MKLKNMKLEKVGIWKVQEIRKSRKSKKLGNRKKQEIGKGGDQKKQEIRKGRKSEKSREKKEVGISRVQKIISKKKKLDQIR